MKVQHPPGQAMRGCPARLSWNGTTGAGVDVSSVSSWRWQMLEREMAVREKEVEAIQAQAKALAQEDQGAGEVERTSRAVEEKFRALDQPLRERCRRLQASREQHQFHRDVEDELVSPGVGWRGPSVPANCPCRLALRASAWTHPQWTWSLLPVALKSSQEP